MMTVRISGRSMVKAIDDYIGLEFSDGPDNVGEHFFFVPNF